MSEPLPPAPVLGYSPGPVCVACRALLRTGAGYCGVCGHRVGDPVAPARPHAEASGWHDVRAVMLVYLLLLGVQMVSMILARVGVAAPVVLQVIEPLFALVVLVAALVDRREIVALYTRAGFGPLGYLLVAVASLPLYGGVALCAEALRAWLHMRDGGDTQILELGVGWAVLVVCILPPVVEELAFRGVLYGRLSRVLSARETLVISSFAFAIMHLSVPMLITHVPLGLYLGWLRGRSKSLWPGMLAHLMHNGWVLILAR